MAHSESAGDKLMRIANTSDLETAIRQLEARKSLQESELRAQFHTVVENLKPKNILKNTLADVRESNPIKSNLLKLVLGLGIGYFSRKLIINESAGILRKGLSTALQFGIANFFRRKKHKNQEDDPDTESAEEKTSAREAS